MSRSTKGQDFIGGARFCPCMLASQALQANIYSACGPQVRSLAVGTALSMGAHHQNNKEQKLMICLFFCSRFARMGLFSQDHFPKILLFCAYCLVPMLCFLQIEIMQKKLPEIRKHLKDVLQRPKVSCNQCLPIPFSD